MEDYVWNGHPQRARGEAMQKMSCDPQFMTGRSAVPAKACKQCHATATPQWRQGPDGPKTLCNACGVKYCRQKKKSTGGKPISAAQQSYQEVLTKQAALRQESALLMPSHEYAEQSAEMKILTRPRTQRKAAKHAISKTSKYAASGDWPDDNGNDIAFFPHRLGSDAVLRSAYSPESDSAEEVHVPPGNFSHVMEVRVGHRVGFCRRPASPDCARQTDEDSVVAASLLCLAQAPQKSTDQFQAEPMQPSHMITSLADLPAEDQRKLIQSDLDRALRDMHEAETAAAAVAEVFTQTQSVAARARERHQRVLKRMRDLTASTVEHEEDVMPQASKRRRVSY